MTKQALNLWYSDRILLVGHSEPIVKVELPLPRLNPHSKTNTLPYIQDPEHGWKVSLGSLLELLPQASASTNQRMCPLCGRQGT